VGTPQTPQLPPSYRTGKQTAKKAAINAKYSSMKKEIQINVVSELSQ
jgi:hypothetical protein